MFCPRCGAECRPDQRFCAKCGAAPGIAENPQNIAVAASTPTEQAVQQPPPEPQATPAPQPPPVSPQAAPALMGPLPDGGLTLEEVVAWLESAGYSAQVAIGNSGKPHIDISMQDTPVTIMVDRTGERSAYLSFVAGFATHDKFDTSRINAWNYDNLWCTAYYDDVNDPWLGMAIHLWPGGTYESLNDRFATWNRTLGRFIDKYTPR